MKLLLWDIDGTLVLYRGVGRRAAESAFGDVFGIDDVRERTEGVHFAGSTDSRILREMGVACGVAAAVFEERRAALRARYLALLAQEVAAFPRDPVLPGVRRVLESLAAEPGARLGLLTGNYEPGARIKLERWGLHRYFPTGGFGDDHEDRRIVASVARARAAAHHGIDPPPDRVLVIGDTVHDVACARANGFRAIGVCTGRTPREDLVGAGAHRVLDDLSSDDALRSLLDAAG